MAVMKMKQINICAMRKDRKHLLEMLQHFGAVEIETVNGDSLERIETAPQKSTFERRVQNARAALDIINEYSQEKNSMLSSLNGRRLISQKDFSLTSQRQDKISDTCKEIIDLKSRIDSERGRILKINGDLESLRPWLGCDVPMGIASTEKTNIFFGSLPASVKDADISSALDKYSAHYEIISQDKNTKYIALFTLKRDTDSVSDEIRKLGFSKPAVRITDIPSVQRDKWIKEIENAKHNISEYENRIRELSEYKSDIEIIADYYSVRAEKYGILGTLPHTRRTFFITGYVPEKFADALKNALVSNFDAAVEISESEDYPVSLENSTFASSFEPVLESFGLPKKHELDPSTIMGVFYVFLFGLMLSDAAYGAIISAVCFFLLKKFKGMEEGMRKSLRMFMYCGLSTLFWGIMFGGYFGDAVTVISQTFFGKSIEIPALWFVPLNDPMRLLMYSMLFGLIHLFTGLAIKGYMILRDGNIKDFICDVLSWFMLLTGLLMLLLGSSIYASLAGSSINFGAAGKITAEILAAAGAAIILFTAGRGSKNPGKRLAKGAYSLYDITSWLSDLLSYSRLLALGLATGVIAQVVNSMGAMAGNGVFGTVMFIIVFIVGHLFNLAINLLGAYVHTNRLQYVEFFGKFYEGGGKKFNPFKENTKYVKIEEE